MKISQVTMSSNVLKGVVHAAAGIGIALDLITVILTAKVSHFSHYYNQNLKDLFGGSRSELAANLRAVAENLEIERMDLHRNFINHVSLAD